MRRGIIALLTATVILLSGQSVMAASPKQGAPCSKIGAVQSNKGVAFKCTRVGKKLVWTSTGGAGAVPSPTATPTPSAIAIDPGVAANVSSASALSSYATCQLKDTRPDQSFPYGASFTPRDWPLKVTGTINVAILPLDFSDYPGTGDPSLLTKQAQDDANAWLDFESQGRLKINWLTTNHWLRLAKTSKFYNFDERKDPMLYAQTEEDMGQQYINAADKTFDFSKLQAAILMFPESTNDIPLGGYSHGYMLHSSHGTVSPIYFGGEYNFPTKPGMWQMWMHEFAHFQGIAGHAPGNGSPLHIMANQFGTAAIMDAWDSAISGWLGAENIACFDVNNLSSTPTTVTMNAIDGPRTGLVSTFVKISKSQVVVIEARKKDKYSDLPPNLEGLVAYVVDTSVVNQRCDACNPGLELDKKQFAYYLRADGANRGYGAYGPLDLSSIAKPGESFTYNGLKIAFVSQAGQTQIQLSRQ